MGLSHGRWGTESSLGKEKGEEQVKESSRKKAGERLRFWERDDVPDLGWSKTRVANDLLKGLLSPVCA